MKRQKTRLSPKHLLLLGAIAAALFVAAVSAYVMWYRPAASPTTTPDTSTPADSGPYDTSPATEQEKQDAEKTKDDLSKPTPAPSTGQKQKAEVVITSADTNSINAYIANILEDGGTCSATLKKGSQTITRTSSGFVDVNKTNCQPINPAFPSSGTWTVTLTYSSATAEGSAQTTVEVP